MLDGSSPLARGTLRRAAHLGLQPRFIPAGAGNTKITQPSKRAPTVHPRWRGEHDLLPHAHGSSAGSSPLARGTLLFSGQMVRAIRFIPAGAGNTPLPAGCWICRPVHPRWRGEHEASADFHTVLGGSSPLARGTRVAEIT